MSKDGRADRVATTASPDDTSGPSLSGSSLLHIESPRKQSASSTRRKPRHGHVRGDKRESRASTPSLAASVAEPGTPLETTLPQASSPVIHTVEDSRPNCDHVTSRLKIPFHRGPTARQGEPEQKLAASLKLEESFTTPLYTMETSESRRPDTPQSSHKPAMERQQSGSPSTENIFSEDSASPSFTRLLLLKDTKSVATPGFGRLSPMMNSFWSMFSTTEYHLNNVGYGGVYLACMVCGVILASLILLVVLILARALKESVYVSVQGPFGKLRGVVMDVEGRAVHAFYNVPFALAPVGKLRFTRPQFMDNVEADATQALPLACPQPLMDNIGFGTRWIVDEDCLRLNIWVPRACVHHEGAESPYRCPNKTVLFVLSGSLFQQGDAGNATKDGSLLAALGDVVVVTFAFRLGALGFLYASADRDAGNMGLYDQIEALNWVRNNIGFFGGNSSAVTVLGHGSGATSIGYHMLSPTSSWHRFIKRFILMGHSPYSRQTDTVERAKNNTAALSSALGCGDALEDLVGAVDCMRQADVSAVLNASAPSSERHTPLFFPTHGTELMPIKPSLMFSAAEIKGREVLIGHTASEGNYLLALIDAIQGAPLFESSLVEHTTRMLRWLGVANPEMVVSVYQDKSTLTGHDWARRVFADVLSGCPQLYFAEQLAPNNSVYNYVINRALSYQRWHGPRDHAGNRAVTRFEDLELLFGLPLKGDYNASYEDQVFSRRIIDIWTSFARNGQLPKVQGHAWPQSGNHYLVAVELGRPEPVLLYARRKTECEALRQHIL